MLFYTGLILLLAGAGLWTFIFLLLTERIESNIGDICFIAVVLFGLFGMSVGGAHLLTFYQLNHIISLLV